MTFQHRAIMRVEINIVHIVIIGRPYACIQQVGKHFLRSNTGNHDFIRSKIVCEAGLKRYLPMVPKETHGKGNIAFFHLLFAVARTITGKTVRIGIL